nr:hypothetical protein [Klebsiella pneumoniae]
MVIVFQQPFVSQIAALRPLLETLPTSDETEVEAESAIPDNWREVRVEE